MRETLAEQVKLHRRQLQESLSEEQNLRKEESERMRETLAEQANLHKRQRQESLSEEQNLRKDENERMRETLRRQVEAARLREETHDFEIRELESRTKREKEKLREEFAREKSRLESSLKAAEIRRDGDLRDIRQELESEVHTKERDHKQAVADLEEKIRALQARFEKGLGELRKKQTTLREEELVKREQAVHELESFFKDAQRKRRAETSDQLDAMHRHYQKALESAEPKTDPKTRPAPIPPQPALVQASVPPRIDQPSPAKSTKPDEDLTVEIQKPARNGRWVKFAILAAVVLGGLLALQQWQGGAGRDHPVPFSHPAALVWENGSLWVADWKEQTVFRMRMDGGRVVEDARFSMPKTHITGMALAEGILYISDSWSHTLQRWRLDRGRLLLEKTWPSPGPNPAALYFDGMHLWSADLTERRLYRHLVDDALTILDSYPIDHAAIGLFADKERFWSADADNRIVFRHRWDRRLTPIRALHLPELENGKSPLSAFTLRGKSVWLGRDGSNVLIERPLWRFEEKSLKASRP